MHVIRYILAIFSTVVVVYSYLSFIPNQLNWTKIGAPCSLPWLRFSQSMYFTCTQQG